MNIFSGNMQVINNLNNLGHAAGNYIIGSMDLYFNDDNFLHTLYVYNHIV